MVASANARLRLETVKLTALFGQHRAVRDVSLLFPAHTVTAIIGPSGCGKSTMLRCLNRMHELTPDASVTGEVLLDNVNIYGGAVSPVELRRRIGMVFQRPTPFPTMSIYDNVAAGLRVNGRRPRTEIDHAVSRALQQAARVSDYTAFMYLGSLIEVGKTNELFTKPTIDQTEAYITGRFG